MTHFLVMILFAAIVAIVFSVLGKDTPKGSLVYGLKVFAEFTLIGLAIAWILYFLPF
jgi:hypothetical protein